VGFHRYFRVALLTSSGTSRCVLVNGRILLEFATLVSNSHNDATQVSAINLVLITTVIKK